MKLASLLSHTALGSVLVSIAGLAFGLAPIALFSFVAAILVVLIGATDYRAPRYYGELAMSTVRRRETMPLAA